MDGVCLELDLPSPISGTEEEDEKKEVYMYIFVELYPSFFE